MATGKYDLKERTFKFAQSILNITELLPEKFQCEIIGKQLARSGTSIGANIEEADGTITKKDFVNKMVIARKEAKETQYWLKTIAGRYLENREIDQHIKECNELIKIISSIVIKSR